MPQKSPRHLPNHAIWNKYNLLCDMCRRFHFLLREVLVFLFLPLPALFDWSSVQSQNTPFPFPEEWSGQMHPNPHQRAFPLTWEMPIPEAENRYFPQYCRHFAMSGLFRWFPRTLLPAAPYAMVGIAITRLSPANIPLQCFIAFPPLLSFPYSDADFAKKFCFFHKIEARMRTFWLLFWSYTITVLW